MPPPAAQYAPSPPAPRADPDTAATGPRTAGRAAARGSRRRAARSGGGMWPVIVLGLVGVVGCGTGAYLLLHGGSGHPACVAAPAPTVSHTATAAPTPTDGGPAVSPGPTTAPLNVRVTILNGSGQFGAAESVLAWMQNKELWTRTSNGGPASPTAKTSLVYEPVHADQARTLAVAMHLPKTALHGTGKGDGLRDPMILTLGKDFQAAGKPLKSPAPPKAPPPPPTDTCAP